MMGKGGVMDKGGWWAACEMICLTTLEVVSLARAMWESVGTASRKALPIREARAALLALCAPFLCIVQMPRGPR